MRFSRLIFILWCLGFVPVPIRAQEPDSTLLTLDRIYQSDEFTEETFGPARWQKNGSGYFTLEWSDVEPGRKDIVRYNAESGARKIVVPTTWLTPANDSISLPIDNYRWSPKEECLLIFTNSKKVWRRKTRGDYWVLNLKNRRLHQLGGTAKPATLMFASFSPDGERVAYVREHNLYVEDLKSGKITQLTFDGSRTIINGTFDWVYEEELDLRNGYRWSPNGKKIAYWQLDASGVGEFYLINNTDSLYPKIIPVQYPKAGTTNSACRVGVVSANGGETTWLQVPGNPRNNYITRMEWAANSDEVLIQHLNRRQNRLEVLFGDAQTGAVKTAFVEQDSAWVEVVNDVKWLREGREFTWVSERDGWRHVYRVSRKDGTLRLITPGNFDIIQIACVGEKQGWLYYIASPENAGQRYLYRSRLSGKDAPQRLTPEQFKGTNSYQISPNAKWAFHTYSTFETPPMVNLIRLPQHKVTKQLLKNEKLRRKIAALKRKPVRFFQVAIADSVSLDAWEMQPYNFNPAKKYPVLFFIYGEPAGQTVLDRWRKNRYLWHLMLTQQEYIVMSVDNRGTPAPKGRRWRKCIYRQVGILASADQAAALREITARYQYVDGKRIGIWGWSGGGSMSLNMIFRYPNLYRTAMAIAPVSNQRFYDTIYQERYMGLPSSNPEGYRNGSPVTFADQLQGNLLIVHGTGDDNVHYQNTEMLVNALIKANKQFTMMAYPNRTHGISEGENTTRHLFELLTDYLQKNLSVGEN